MRVKIFSDLHAERGNKSLAEKLVMDSTADVIVFAGDFIHLGKTAEFLKSIDSMTACPLLYVPGNHDYYGTRRATVDADLDSKAFKNIVVLNERTHFIDDVCFIGATGWWDISVSQQAASGMNDFAMIADIDQSVKKGEWGQAKNFFYQALSKKKGKKTVCISHHAPSLQSIPEDLKSRAVNQCYANAWDDLIEEFQPDLWIHGHIHQTSSDYLIGRTRVVSNPYGYANKQVNPEWQENFVVEL